MLVHTIGTFSIFKQQSKAQCHNVPLTPPPPSPPWVGELGPWIHTRVHKITNVPVVYMARAVVILMRGNPLLGPLEGVGPENLDFLGPQIALA
jgi:hypothetical protein